MLTKESEMRDDDVAFGQTFQHGTILKSAFDREKKILLNTHTHIHTYGERGEGKAHSHDKVFS